MKLVTALTLCQKKIVFKYCKYLKVREKIPLDLNLSTAEERLQVCAYANPLAEVSGALLYHNHFRKLVKD